MVSFIYIALAALLIVKLSLNVIALRKKYKIRVGDGDNQELLRAIRTHANATEYLPIALLLLLGLEINSAPKLLLHALGILLLRNEDLIKPESLLGHDLMCGFIRTVRMNSQFSHLFNPHSLSDCPKISCTTSG